MSYLIKSSLKFLINFLIGALLTSVCRVSTLNSYVYAIRICTVYLYGGVFKKPYGLYTFIAHTSTAVYWKFDGNLQKTLGFLRGSARFNPNIMLDAVFINEIFLRIA